MRKSLRWGVLSASCMLLATMATADRVYAEESITQDSLSAQEITLKEDQKTLREKQDELAMLNNTISNTIIEKETLAGQIIEKEAAIKTLQAEINQKSELYQENLVIAKKRLQTVQLSGPRADAYFSAIINSESMTDVLGSVFNLQLMFSSQNDFMDKVKADEEELIALDRQAKAEQEMLLNQKEDLDEMELTLQEDKEKAMTELNALSAFIQEQEVEYAANQATWAIGQSEKEAKAMADMLAETQKMADELKQSAEGMEQALSGGLSAPTTPAWTEEAVESVVTPPVYVAPVVTPAPVVNTQPAPAPVTQTPTVSDTPKVPEPVVTPAPVVEPQPAAPTQSVSSVISIAQQYIGVPYVWGGSTPSGFDCSGLVQYVYKQAGISLPRVTSQQEYMGTKISLYALQPGDLVFWGTRGNTHHVAIYIGNNQYVHAPQPGQAVQVGSFSWFKPDFGIRL